MDTRWPSARILPLPRARWRLLTSTGIPTSVCFGFLKTLLEVMASEQPEAMAIAFDLGAFTTPPTTPIKQTDQAHRKTSFRSKNLHELLKGFALSRLQVEADFGNSGTTGGVPGIKSKFSLVIAIYFN